MEGRWWGRYSERQALVCLLQVDRWRRPAGASRRLIEAPWWSHHLGAQAGSWWLETVDGQALRRLPLRVRVGLLHAVEDLLKHLGHNLAPFLPLLFALLVLLLEPTEQTVGGSKVVCREGILNGMI
jgi:hypothetical protein